MKPISLKAIFFLLFSFCVILTSGQDNAKGNEGFTKSPITKPYKVLTNGKQITIQSIQILRSVMVWTSGGHRVAEEKFKNETSYTFTVSIKEKIFYVMIELSDGKRFTEKIGVK